MTRKLVINFSLLQRESVSIFLRTSVIVPLRNYSSSTGYMVASNDCGLVLIVSEEQLDQTK